MNFLAHLFLSDDDQGLLCGNFVADLIPIKTAALLPAFIQKGVRMHRAIDQYTDAHPRVKQASYLLHEKHHKYAPVIIDVSFDYFLHKHWDQFTEEPFDGFRKRVYKQLLQTFNHLPEALAARMKTMIEHDWLLSYTSVEALEAVFLRMQQRISKMEHWQQPVQTVLAHEVELEMHFLAFFPELGAFCRQFDQQTD